MKAIKFDFKNVFVWALVIAVCVLLFDKCGNEKSVVQIQSSDSLKNVISQQYERRIDSLKAIEHKDSIRVEYVVKWRKIKQDTEFLPCDSILTKIVNLCDSIIYVDSSQIATLKNVISIDDSIIANYKKTTKQDSINIVLLNKEVKKHKKHKKFLFAGLIGVGVISILK